jgi:exosome complex component CSL4
MDGNQRIPGEKIALIEEYLAGDNTYEENDTIRATTIGNIQLDTSERLASINPQKQISVPKVGDIVIGVVEANLPSMIAIMIKFVNGKKANSDLECICVTRHIRKKNIALAKDVVKVEIISHINGTIHASIDSQELGVLFTKCRKCFGTVVKMRDAVKCKDCGWIDDRKLSLDFGKSKFLTKN